MDRKRQKKSKGKARGPFLLLFFFTVVVALNGFSEVPVREESTAWVNVSSLNMRYEANINSMRITVLPMNTQLELLSMGDEWSYIRYDGMEGYVMTQHLILSKPNTETHFRSALTPQMVEKYLAYCQSCE